MAISQNIGTFLTAMLPALFATVAPPGTENIPMVIGTLALATTVISAVAAFTARETFRLPLEKLGDVTAQPLDETSYLREREMALRG